MSINQNRVPPGVELVHINTGVLISGLPYQRPVRDQDVDNLLLEWSDSLMDPLIVNYRDERFYLVDGQHRAMALRKRNGGQNVPAPCRLYRGLTYQEEADLCYRLDQSRRRMSLAEATKALLQSGIDPMVTDIQCQITAAGFLWSLDGRFSNVPHTIIAVRAVINAYRMLGSISFGHLLCLLEMTWHGAPASLKSDMISGMALFLNLYENKLDDALFVARLSAVNPEEIRRKTRIEFTTRNVALRCARVLWRMFNDRQYHGKKLPYRFKS